MRQPIESIQRRPDDPKAQSMMKDGRAVRVAGIGAGTSDGERVVILALENGMRVGLFADHINLISTVWNKNSAASASESKPVGEGREG